jgi:hypothetical protein
MGSGISEGAASFFAQLAAIGERPICASPITIFRGTTLFAKEDAGWHP